MSDEHDRWHRAVCNELEGRVESRTFLIWVDVQFGQGEGGSTTQPEEVDVTGWEALAASTEGWLEGLDPQSLDADNPPKHEVRVADLAIELTASPKKTKRQGTGSLIGNPYLGVVSFTESYTTGPADPFEDDS